MSKCVFRWTWLLLLPLVAAGCGGLHSVKGKVTFDDGQPVTGGMVVFESKDANPPVTARAEIQSDGSFSLGTRRPGDGAPAGLYRVLVSPPPPEDPRDRKAKPPFEERYTDFKTSGLEFEVKSGGNDCPIQLKRSTNVRRQQTK